MTPAAFPRIGGLLRRARAVVVTCLLTAGLAWPAAGTAQQAEPLRLEVPAGATLRATLGTASVEARVLARERPFELVGLDGTRVSSDEAEGLAVGLDGVSPFRVELAWGEEEGAPPATMAVSWAGGLAEVALLPLDDRLERWGSEWLVLAGESRREEQAVAGLPDPNSQASAEAALALFRGAWRVFRAGREASDASIGADPTETAPAGEGIARRGPAGHGAHGLAVVQADGLTIDLFLHDGEAARQYRSFEVWAREDHAGGGTHRLDVRFEEVTDGAPLRPAGADWPEHRLLYLPEATAAATITVGQASVAVGFPKLEGRRDRFRVQLDQRAPTRLAGAWSIEEGGGIRSAGQQTWVREARVEGVAVLDDQRGVGGPDIARAYRYPFGEAARGSGAPETGAGHVTERMLFIYGTGLPAGVADAVVIGSDDAHLSYEFEFAAAEAPFSRRDVVEAGWREAGIDEPGDRDAVVVRARLEPGVEPGGKSLQLNFMPAPWLLDFSDNIGWLSFMRYGGAGSEPAEPLDRYGTAAERRPLEPVETLFTSDVIHIEIDEEVGFPLDEVEVALTRNGRPVGDGTVVLRRPDGPADLPYTSPPIRLWRSDRDGHAPPGLPSAISIDVRPGDVIAARPVDPLALPTLPEAFEARVADDPGALGPLWGAAVERMAACYAGTGPAAGGDPGRTLHLEAAVHARFFLTELSRRAIRINRGDHAAAILLRDEFAAMMDTVIDDHARAAADRGSVAGFIERSRPAAGPFWSAATVHDPLGGEVPAFRMLDAGRHAEEWGMGAAEAEDHAVAQVRLALLEYVQAMRATRARAWAAGDCRVDELLVIAGRSMEPVVARLMPRLVVLRDTEGARYWEPDPVARSHVRTLHIVGDAVRALDAYAAIDSAYQQMLLAAATGGVAFGITRVGAWAGLRHAATAGRLAAVGGDLADAAYFGTQAVNEYVGGQRRIDYATGASAVLGDDFLIDAQLAAAPWWGVAMAALMPAGSAGLNLAAVGAARGVDAARRGARVLENVGTLEPAVLARLSDAERVDLASLYTGLAARRMREGTSGLTPAERHHLATFDAYFTSGPARSPSASRPPAMPPGPLAAASPDPASAPTVRLLPPDPATAATVRLPPLDPAMAPTVRLPPPDPATAATVRLPPLDPATAATVRLPPPDPATAATVRLPPLDPATAATVRLPPPDPATAPTVRLPPLDPATAATIRLPPLDPAMAPTVRLPPPDPATAATVRLPPLDPAMPPAVRLPAPDEVAVPIVSRSAPTEVIPGDGTAILPAPDLPASMPPASRPAAPAVSATPSEPMPEVPSHLFREAPVRITGAGGRALDLQLGERIGMGSFNEVYAHPGDPGRVIRISRYASDTAEARFDQFGREALEHMRPRLAGEIELIGGEVLTHVDTPLLAGRTVAILDRVDGTAARLAAGNPDGLFTPGQAIAYDRAVRALNREGFAILDGHPHNYTFRPRPGDDDWVMLVIDSGGIVPVRGATPAQRAANARRLQALVDDPPPGLMPPAEELGPLGPGNVWYDQFKAEALRQRDELTELLDTEALGLSLDQIPAFRPTGAEPFPKARGLASVPDADLDAAYLALRAAGREPL